ncbi:TasA family protein [Clostridium sp. D33t1_170424_F3]|uniref:TasA family protein n=1 Tax=Clostridium sp. D33t1_170424_F3 TaxID=2787099 RepID=UPI0018A960FA|nr:TasA family protein [Clostridium sp. D33t1_170424_F3]
MKNKRLLLSAISLLLVLCLLAGGTMAWFTDTEKVRGDFSAGVLDITLTPGGDTTAPLAFENLRPMTYDGFKAEINAAGTGNENTEGYDPMPQYFQPVVIKNTGTLPVYIEVSVQALNMAETACPKGGEKELLITADEKGRETVRQVLKEDGTNAREACTNGLSGVLRLVLFEKIGGVWTVVSDNLNSGAEGKPYAPGVIIPAATGEQTYVVGAYLPETVGNAYQAKHFHGNLVVKAFQTDEGAGAPEPDKPDENVQRIETEEQLRQLAADVNAGMAEQKTYRLTNDIVLNGEWTPIGTGEHPFTGTFDGNGYSISGLQITKPGSYQGLFGDVVGGTIRNLSLKEVNISFGGQYQNWIGGVAGALEREGRIENCRVEGNVKANGYDNMLVGGIVGTVESGTVSGCTFSGNVRSSEFLGGIAGRLMKGTIENCGAFGDVWGKTAGGVVGAVAANGAVVSCYAANTVLDGGNAKAAGIAATVTGGSVSGCTALNPYVKTPTGAYSRMGRIAGTATNAKLSNNYAWEGVKILYNYTVSAGIAEGTPSGKDGGGLSVQSGKLMDGAEEYAGAQPEALPGHISGG